MMKKTIKLILTIMICCIMSCTDKNTAGYEYMPDMYHSTAVETYVVSNVFNDSLSARQPVSGTIPRGFMPFEYDNSTEDYIKAGKELSNPIELSDKVLDEGESLYVMFCAHCHGKKGDGKGSITHPLYSNIPSYSDDILMRRSGVTMKELRPGHIFHAITYGLNAMGPHLTQISQEDRWKIVHYVNTLQK